MLRAFAVCVAAIPVGAIAIVRGGVAKRSTNPNYQDSVECSRKVSSLSDETNRLLTQHQQIDRGCADALKYYEDMITSVDQSNAHLKDRVAAKDTDDELAQVYRERYTGSMCMKTYEAFFLKDEDARLEVLHICMGRKSLAPSSFLRRRAHLDDMQQCPQAKHMQERVDQLRAARAQKVAECRTRKLELKNKLAEKRRTEDKLEEQYYGHHSNKAKIRTQVAGEVENKFCKVILANYKLKEEKIQKYFAENCAKEQYLR